MEWRRSSVERPRLYHAARGESRQTDGGGGRGGSRQTDGGGLDVRAKVMCVCGGGEVLEKDTEADRKRTREI